jgi:hypothetical protein
MLIHIAMGDGLVTATMKMKPFNMAVTPMLTSISYHQAYQVIGVATDETFNSPDSTGDQ